MATKDSTTFCKTFNCSISGCQGPLFLRQARYKFIWSKLTVFFPNHSPWFSLVFHHVFLRLQPLHPSCSEKQRGFSGYTLPQIFFQLLNMNLMQGTLLVYVRQQRGRRKRFFTTFENYCRSHLQAISCLLLPVRKSVEGNYVQMKTRSTHRFLV